MCIDYCSIHPSHSYTMTTKEFNARLSAFASANNAKASSTRQGIARTIVKDSAPFKRSVKAEDDPNNIGDTVVTPPSVGFSINPDGSISNSIEPGSVEYDFYEPEYQPPQETASAPSPYTLIDQQYINMGEEVLLRNVWENSSDPNVDALFSDNIVVSPDGTLTSYRADEPLVSDDGGTTWYTTPNESSEPPEANEDDSRDD